MELDKFRCLTNIEQDIVLRHEAVYLGEIKDGLNTYMLFQLDSFYLEIYFRGSEKCALNYFDEIELLAPYLEMIDMYPIRALLGYSNQ
jgi:hypothetical protein